MLINRKIQNKTRIWGEGHCYSAVKLPHAEQKHKWNTKYEVKDRGKQSKGGQKTRTKNE
jgi:hypothetical protein